MSTHGLIGEVDLPAAVNFAFGGAGLLVMADDAWGPCRSPRCSGR
jgi:hypothetical protein